MINLSIRFVALYCPIESIYESTFKSIIMNMLLYCSSKKVPEVYLWQKCRELNAKLSTMLHTWLYDMFSVS